MYNIVDAIYQMLGSQTKTTNNNQPTGDEKEEDPKTRVDRIFEQLDKVGNTRIVHDVIITLNFTPKLHVKHVPKNG